MGLLDFLKKKKPTPETGAEKVTITPLPPKYVEPVKGVDYVDASGKSAGGVTKYGGGGGGSSTPVPSPTSTQDTIVKSGTVTQGTNKYIGNAVVPGTNLTANQYGLLIRQQAIQQGLVNQENANMYSYKINNSSTSSQEQQAQRYDFLNKAIQKGNQDYKYQMSKIQEQSNAPQKKQGFINNIFSSGVISFTGSEYLFNKDKREEATNFIQSGATNFVFNRDNPFIGIGFDSNLISRGEISSALQKGGTAGKVADILLPGSVFDIALVGGTAGIYSVASPVIRTGISAYTGYSGINTAFNPSLPTEQRIAGGIIGGLGGLGTAYEVYPYIKGIKARVSPSYNPVVSEEGGVVHHLNH